MIMQIKLYQPLALHEKGRRGKNEDSIFPTLNGAGPHSRVFLVCDGVGGEAHGEVASEIVADTFGTTFNDIIADEKTLNQTLTVARDKINTYVQEHPESKGMATTFTFLQFHERGATVAHAGDSRVYQIRHNKIIFCTEDHSLVNDLRRKGLHEEADSTSNSIITRAIQGSVDREVRLEVRHIHNIVAGDYFLLCSDGVWGVLPNKMLLDIFEKTLDDTDKIKKIKDVCAAASKDNFSAYLLHIEETILSMARQPLAETGKFPAAVSEIRRRVPEIHIENNQRSRNTRWVIPVLILSLMTGTGGIGWYSWQHNHNEASMPAKTALPNPADLLQKSETLNNISEPVSEKQNRHATVPAVNLEHQQKSHPATVKHTRQPPHQSMAIDSVKPGAAKTKILPDYQLDSIRRKTTASDSTKGK